LWLQEADFMIFDFGCKEGCWLATASTPPRFNPLVLSRCLRRVVVFFGFALRVCVALLFFGIKSFLLQATLHGHAQMNIQLHAKIYTKTHQTRTTNTNKTNSFFLGRLSLAWLGLAWLGFNRPSPPFF